MRRTVMAVVAASALVGGFVASPAQAEMGPANAKVINRLLTKSEMTQASGYRGVLGDYDGGPARDCVATPEYKMTSCSYQVYAETWEIVDPYPYLVSIDSFRNARALNRIWALEAKPVAPDGYELVEVIKTQKSVSFYAVPEDPMLLPMVSTTLKGRLVLVRASCSVTSGDPGFAALRACSEKVAAAQLVKAQQS